ncbi:MAG: LD-carboxypeptidase, partial [Neisseriaceae bacterium]|nr:LD-carboxypeptidase [Neisseriaceae bacterium]
LSQGDTIAIIAPAGVVNPQEVAAMPAWLAARGYQAKIYPCCLAVDADFPYLAGDDALRVADLHAAFGDPTVAAIFCARGGYGTQRLLPLLDDALIAANPKPFVGYSDITALHSHFNLKLNLPTFHGGMMAVDLIRYACDTAEKTLFALLTGAVKTGQALAGSTSTVKTLNRGNVTGRLLGGNLAMISSSLGTPWGLDVCVKNTQRPILFIEDINEAPYKIDRMLNQLRLAGILQQLGGVVVGDFSDDTAPLVAPVLEKVWHYYFNDLTVPVLTGWPAGHCTPNYALPLGVLVTLDATKRSLILAQNIF